MGLRRRTWLTRTYCKFYTNLRAYILSAILSSIWHSVMAYIPTRLPSSLGSRVKLSNGWVKNKPEPPIGAITCTDIYPLTLFVPGCEQFLKIASFDWRLLFLLIVKYFSTLGKSATVGISRPLTCFKVGCCFDFLYSGAVNKSFEGSG